MSYSDVSLILVPGIKLQPTGILGVALADGSVAAALATASLQREEGVLGIATTAASHQINQPGLAFAVIMRVSKGVVLALVPFVAFHFAQSGDEVGAIGTALDRGVSGEVARLGCGRG